MTRADPIRGRQLAERLCTNCHVVVPGNDLTVTRSGPDFQKIANRPDQTPERIAGAMIIPHPDMPTVALTMREVRDIVSYINSLKTTP
ncbi:MAG: c-type cytochrome [Hyphomicrobiaceae bacterium]